MKNRGEGSDISKKRKMRKNGEREERGGDNEKRGEGEEERNSKRWIERERDEKMGKKEKGGV